MIKKIIPALSLSSMLLVSTVHAADFPVPEGWYVGGNVGNSTDYSYDNFFSHPLFGVNVGYKKGSLRGEAQYNYQRLQYSTFPIQQKGNYNALGLNGYYDFDNHTMFSPYVGVGVMGSNVNYSSPNVRITSDTSVNVSALLGMRAYVTDNLALDLGYRTNEKTAALGVAYHFE